MKTKILILASAVAILFVGGVFIFQRLNAQPVVLLTGEMTNFNFIFKYGINAKNELNTFNGTYTKDMVIDPSLTINLRLTNDELARVYQKIYDLKLLKEEKEPKSEFTIIATPCSTYSFKFKTDTTQEELSWSNCHGKISDKFKKFSDYIISIIESKEEVRKMPQPRAMYL